MTQGSTFNQEEVSRIANKLISNTFIVKSNKKDTKDYYLAKSHKKSLIEYFRIIDWQIDFDDVNGVIHLFDKTGRNKSRLKKNESVFLLLLRLMHLKKAQELSLLDNVVLTMDELQNEFRVIDLNGDLLKKTELFNLLKKMKRMNIINYKGSGDSIEVIEVYPSIVKALPTDGIKDLSKRLNRYYSDDVEKGEQIDE